MTLLRPMLLASMLTLTLGAPVAAAQPGDPALCDPTVIVDPTDLLEPEDIQRLEEAAADLASGAGVDVRAVLLSDTAGAGIDAWADEQLTVCGSWQREDGESADRLLVLAVSLDDRQTGSYYGIDLAPDLNGERDRVHDRTMAPFLREGAFAEALIQGLDDYGRVLASAAEGAPAPTTDGAGESTAAPGLPSGPVVTTAPDGPTPPGTQDRPTDEALEAQQALLEDRQRAAEQLVDVGGENEQGPFGALGVLGGGVLGLAGVVVGGRYVTERRRRHALFEQASAARATARGTYFDLTQTWADVHDQTVVTLGTLDATDSLAAELSREIDEAEQALGALGEALTSAVEPVVDENIDEVHAAWGVIAGSASETEREVAEVVDRLGRVERARAALPGDLAAARQEFDRVSERVEAYRSSGQDVDQASAMLAWAETSLDGAESADPIAHTGAALDGLAAATTATAEAEAVADRHAALRASLPGRHADIERRQRDVAAGADTVLAVLTDLQRRWARAVWDDLADAADEYAAHHARCTELLTHAADLIAEHRYDGAAELLDAADAAVDAMVATLDEVTDRDEDVAATLDGWDGTVARTNAAIDEAGAFLRGREMPTVFAQRLEAAVRLRDDALVAWDGADPLTASERAHGAERAATDVLASARADADRRQQQAEAALADAARHLKRANSYKRTYHHGDDIQLLGDRRSAIIALLAAGSYDTAIERASELSRDADRVADAVRREHQSRQASFHSSNSFGSSGFGGGGSSSFGAGGGGGFGGGGSSSFGGGGGGGSFGGGGSSGW